MYKRQAPVVLGRGAPVAPFGPHDPLAPRRGELFPGPTGIFDPNRPSSWTPPTTRFPDGSVGTITDMRFRPDTGALEMIMRMVEAVQARADEEEKVSPLIDLESRALAILDKLDRSWL